MSRSFSWRAASGRFGNPFNWTVTSSSASGGTLPRLTDNVDFGPAAKGDTITGTGSVNDLTVETVLVLNGTFAANLITDSGQVTVKGGALSAAAGLNVSGTLTLNSGKVTTGTFTDTGTAGVSGGVLQSTVLLADSGVLGVSGPGRVDAAAIAVGESAAGIMSVTAGGGVTDASAVLGAGTAEKGTATVTGTGSAWQTSGTLTVGSNGIGVLAVQAGGSVTAGTLAMTAGAGGTGSSVTVSGAGTQLNVSGSAYIGQAGSAALSILSGGTLSAGTSIVAGAAPAGMDTIVIASVGSSLHAGATLLIGDDGDGTLAVQAGATATATTLTVADIVGRDGAVSVDGPGSAIVVTTATFGGGWSAAGGSAQVSISNGGRIDASGWALVWGPAAIVLAGGTLEAAGVVVHGSISGSGTLQATATAAGYQVMNSGTVTAAGGTLDVVGGITGTGALNITSGAQLVLQGSVGATQTVSFAAGTAQETLALNAPAQMAASISGFTGTDRIELIGETASKVAFSNGVLTVSGFVGSGTVLQTLGALNLSGSYTAASFAISTDGKGDSLITLAAATTPVAPVVPVPINESDYLETHRFFAATSDWNTAIGASVTATAIPNIATYATGLTSWLSGGGNVAIYYAQNTDPLVEVLYNSNTWSDVASGAWARSGNSTAVEQQILASSSALNPIPGNPYSTQTAGLYWNSSLSGMPASYDAWHQTAALYIHVPVGALPTASSDGQTVVIQQDGTAVEMYSPIVLSSGQWVSEMFSETNAVTGSGTGADNGRTASMIENYAGVLRDTDVASGVIDHALALAVPPAMLKAAFTGPALAFDSGSGDYSGTLAMGSHLGLAASVNIASMGLTTSLGAEIAKAAQVYGMYIVDRGGSGISVVTQNQPTSAALGSWSSAEQSDLNIIFHHETLLSS